MSKPLISVRGATGAQMRTVRAVLADLKSVTGALWKPVRINVIFTQVVIEEDIVHGADWVGWYWGATEDEPDQIFLQPDLVGKNLYAVMLHELGHFLGMDHTKRGLMAAMPRLPGGRLTTGWRKRCLRSFYLALLKHRLRKLL